MAQSFDPSKFAVLVVEDEPLLLMDAMDMIEEAGFSVFGAENADAAIRLLERHSEIRVLFTDIDMPGTMDGLKLAHAVRGRWPPVSIIVVSGHIRLGKAELPENGLFFSKPYHPKRVIDALTRMAVAD